MNFKNAIVKSINIELPGFANDIKEMIIEEEFGNDYYGDLLIENYPNLEKIVVKKNSLKNLKMRNIKIIKYFQLSHSSHFLKHHIQFQ